LTPAFNDIVKDYSSLFSDMEDSMKKSNAAQSKQ